MTLLKSNSCLIRKANPQDGQHIWQTVVDSRKLDVNSAYCYIMLSEYFSDTCLIAEIDGRIIGFVTAFIRQSDPEVLFVWQIAVSESHRGKGIADSLLQRLISSKCCEEVRFVETTISPGNTASQQLFAKFAEGLRASRVSVEGFSSHLFPGEVHEDEHLVRIGPISRQIATREECWNESFGS